LKNIATPGLGSEVGGTLKFVPVENVDEVLAVALEKNGAVPSASENKAA